MTNEEKIMYAKVFNVSSNWIGRRAKRVQSIDEVDIGNLCAYKYKEEVRERNYTQQVTKYWLGVCTSKDGKKIFSKINCRKDSNGLLSWYVSSSFELRCEYEYDLHILDISAEDIQKLKDNYQKEQEKQRLLEIEKRKLELAEKKRQSEIEHQKEEQKKKEEEERRKIAEEHYKEEKKRRSQKLNITVGMYEDLLCEIHNLKQIVNNLSSDY